MAASNFSDAFTYPDGNLNGNGGWINGADVDLLKVISAKVGLGADNNTASSIHTLTTADWKRPFQLQFNSFRLDGPAYDGTDQVIAIFLGDRDAVSIAFLWDTYFTRSPDPVADVKFLDVDGNEAIVGSIYNNLYGSTNVPVVFTSNGSATGIITIRAYFNGVLMGTCTTDLSTLLASNLYIYEQTNDHPNALLDDLSLTYNQLRNEVLPAGTVITGGDFAGDFLTFTSGTLDTSGSNLTIANAVINVNGVLTIHKGTNTFTDTGAIYHLGPHGQIVGTNGVVITGQIQNWNPTKIRQQQQIAQKLMKYSPFGV